MPDDCCLTAKIKSTGLNLLGKKLPDVVVCVFGGCDFSRVMLMLLEACNRRRAAFLMTFLMCRLPLSSPRQQ